MVTLRGLWTVVNWFCTSKTCQIRFDQIIYCDYGERKKNMADREIKINIDEETRRSTQKYWAIY